MSDVPCIPISSLYFNLGRPCHILSALCAYSRKHAIPFAILKDHTLRIERAPYYSFFLEEMNRKLKLQVHSMYIHHKISTLQNTG